MSLPLALLRIEISSFLLPLPKNLDIKQNSEKQINSFHIQIGSQRIQNNFNRICKELAKNLQRIHKEFPRIPKKSQKQFPKNSQDFENIQFPTSHLDCRVADVVADHDDLLSKGLSARQA